MNPLQQFEVHEISSFDLFGLHVQWTNQSLWVTLATLAAILLFTFGIRKKEMVPGRLQAFVELTFEFIQGMVKDTTGTAGMKFLPLVMTIFLFIAFLNVFGMIPGSFTATSQIYMTGLMSVSVFLLVVLIGFVNHGIKFLGMFYPSGTPLWLAPLVVPLEIISFFARPFTLAIRLCANMVAGHILLKIVAMFVIMIGSAFALASVVPLVFLVALTALEVFVALLQAYIFTVLCCVYLNDALHLH